MKRRLPASTDLTPATVADTAVAAELIQRRELALLALILLAGVSLRIFALSRSTVEHFDEGVYASNLYFGPPDYAYPLQRFYAPPLLPALIETGMIAGLPPNLAALLPGFLAGCGTIVALWWFGRSWFSPAVGLAAATLAALSEFHITYSPTALTDVLLGLWIVLAVDAIARSLAGEDFRWAIAAGIYTGLAWWTKYNGWLPLAIEAAALPLLWLVTQRSIVRKLGCFVTTVAVAVVVWLPYYLSLASTGGYGPIAANHANYVVGFAGWLDSASRQIAAQHVMEGPLSAAALGIAAVALWIAASNGHRPAMPWMAGLAAAIAMALALRFTSFVVLGLLGGAGLAWSLIVAWSARTSGTVNVRSAVGTCLVAAWWLGLLVATPCYWPYPRLVLPWLMASWLGGALFCQQCVQLANRSQKTPATQPWSGLAIVVAGLAGIMLLGSSLSPALQAPSRPDAASYQRIAAEIHAGSGLPEIRAIYTCGEPALLFQLRAAGEPLVAPSRDIPHEAVTIDGAAIATLLILGPHARGDLPCQQQWAERKNRWELIASYDYMPRHIVRLDLYDPRQPPALDQSALNRIEVYRLK
ncbi:MAG TPA: glycosyltransferase family 39 protein [Pirellulaceae bacterium]|nr:glycosyltransferase family 39 protein [Pirellulaceae bacterium]